VALVLATSIVSAQGGGGGGGGGGAPSLGAYKVPTLFEELSGTLKLDYKTQEPAVQEILAAANKDATPIVQDMFTLRQRILAAEVAGKPDLAKAATDEYALTTAKMAAVESEAFKKIYALLKPNQQAKAVDAFGLMGGMFLPRTAPRQRAAGAGGGGGARPGGGGGR
jgi:hypothetical protein